MTPPTAPRVAALRALALSVALGAALAGAALFLQFASSSGLTVLDTLRGALIGGTMAWLAWGAVQAMLGLLYRTRPVPRLSEGARIEGRTVVLLPICHEDPRETFARLAAIDASLENAPARVDFAVLSDSRDPAAARAEAFWFSRLLAERNGAGRMFYRRRERNLGRKAGNIGEFLAESGGAYDYALVLDADSLMEGDTIVEMIRRMEADPGLGLLQTLPQVVGARTLFGRAMQFAASLHSPIFARGIATLQGPAGPFWGHNALVRVRAFAASCHLPPLSGKPPFGGHVLSHDTVEAALLVRGGWRVRLDPDLGGSFEEGPQDVLEHARRDRRWCQGNLQHLRLLGAPRLSPWGRFALAQGIASYLMPLLWLVLLLTAVPAVLLQSPPDYFPDGYVLFPVFPTDETAKALALGLGVVAVLIAPKIAILLTALCVGAAPAFGGRLRLAVSTLAELALSTLLAPILLMLQTRAVLQVLVGTDGGWPATPRGARGVGVLAAARATWWIVIAGAAGLAVPAVVAPELVPWALPVALPMIAAPLVVSWTSQPSRRLLFHIREEIAPSPVIAQARAVERAWSEESEPLPGEVAAHG
jgi:membrane glycosyltransferase